MRTAVTPSIMTKSDDDDDDRLVELGTGLVTQSIESNESSIAGQLESTARVIPLTVTDGLDLTHSLSIFTIF